MKILILDTDVEYVRRLGYYLHLYADDMQVIDFQSPEKLRSYMESEEFDVVLCGKLHEIQKKEDLQLPAANLPFAWLSENHEVIDQQTTIYKYQSIPKIYDALCDLYESVYQRTLLRERKGMPQETGELETEIITFFPVHGGAGSSAMAVSCAQDFSKTDSILYLNLEQFSSDTYFAAENERTFSDIIAEMRGKYTDESLKKEIALTVSQQTERLAVIRGCKNAVDISCLTKKMLLEILRLIRAQKLYRYVIIDAGMFIGELTSGLVQASDKLVFTMDASDMSREKLQKVLRYVQVEQRGQSGDPAEHFLIYNKFYSDAELSDYTKGMVVVGKFGRYRLKENQQISFQTVVQNICRTPQLFEKLR